MTEQRKWIAACLLFLVGAAHGASSNIDPNAKFAWAENAGYINFAATFGGATVTTTFLSGFVWCETAGWVKLGVDSGGPYANTSATDYGVNVSGATLSGYAWSENAGWIRFNPTAGGGGVTLGLDGSLDGYAWCETLGYVHFKNASPQYNVKAVLPANQPPVVAALNSDNNPALLNQTVTYNISATDADTPVLNYTFNFGDGSPDLKGTFPQGTSVPLMHVYTEYSDIGLTVSLTVSDGLNPPVTVKTLQTIPMPSSTGVNVTNVALNAPPIVAPLDGLSVAVQSSDGGVLQLGIDVNSLTRAAYSVSTDWSDVAGRSATVSGTSPTHQYVSRGLFVAKTTATNKSTNMVAGKARITLALSSKETGDFPTHLREALGGRQMPRSAPTNDSSITTKSIKGKFDFSGKKADSVSFQGIIKFQAGVNPSLPYEFWVAVGNIVVKSTIVKGKGTVFEPAGVVKTLKVTSKVKKGVTTIGGEPATISVTYSAMNTVSNGFDTEGISNQSTDVPKGKSAPRKIQVAMLVDGSPFQAITPVNFSLSKNNDFGGMAGRK